MSELDPQNQANQDPSEIAKSEIAGNGPQDEPASDPQNLINLDSETVKTKDKKKKKKKDEKERDPERDKKKKDKKDKKLKIKGELFDDANVNDDGSVGGARSVLDEDDNIDAVIKNTKQKL